MSRSQPWRQFRVPLIFSEHTVAEWVRLIDDLATGIRAVHPKVAVPQSQVANLTTEVDPENWTGSSQDSPHFQTAPKVLANTGTSASMAANFSINGSSRLSGIVGMRS
jgi:hypothetical protein